MYNYVMLIGAIVELKKNLLVLRVMEPFKNQYGRYSYEDYEIIVPDGLYEIIKDREELKYISVKGRLSKNNGTLEVIAERFIIAGE